jgi:uncharacterized caspase-like protein
MLGQIISCLNLDEATSTENFMIGSEWLRAKLTGKNGEADPSTTALLSDLAKNTEQMLAVRVNELLEGKNKYSLEAHESLVEQAIKSAREKVEAAEAELEQVKSEVEFKIHQIEEQMERTAFKLAAAEQRATVAEERADKAEESLRRLQAEILTLTYWKSLVPRAA